ncbi:tRNA dihydrouridine synthase DusB [Murdochiella massiliensis]|uniref:tRNA dihydrouridine synthase DusB n=1 Tax=Murdochiella massiliensis TaxID=1673723 RepID=UPI000AD99935|nr:tRNA dihydrouridine synthase DusB [Murdochiella massiliensis]
MHELRKQQECAMGTGRRKEPVSAFVSLAPLAGVSDRCFREICFHYGCDEATTEMISAQALLYDSVRTEHMLEKGAEGKLTVQLFGKDPLTLAKVISERFNTDDRFQAVELNMGCPAPKIVRNGEGSALMCDPRMSATIFRAMVQASSKPIYVKMRLGWDDNSMNYLTIAHIAEEEGVSRITLHARTREQMYAGKANWEAIAHLKDAVNVQVVGNGDVTTPEEVEEMEKQTRCDGIAIGRAAMGNPFLFRQIYSYRSTGAYAPVSREETISVLLDHYVREIACRGEQRAILEMRKLMACYLSGFSGSARTKAAIMTMTDMKEIRAELERFRAQDELF